MLRLLTYICTWLAICNAALSDTLPQHEAPFGLRFGMAETEVQLPVVAELESPRPSGTFPYLPNNKEKIAYYERTALIADCTRTFDELLPVILANEALANRFLDQFPRTAVMDFMRSDAPQHKAYCSSPHKTRFSLPPVSTYRQIRLHSVGLNGRRRTICLVFTRHGLSHLYLSGYEFADLLPEIQARLSQNTAYEQHFRRTLDPNGRKRLRELPSPVTDGCPPPSMDEVLSNMDFTRERTWEDRKQLDEAEWREMQNRSFAPGDRSAIAERRAWIDRNRQILHVSKTFLERDTSFVEVLKEKTMSAEPLFDWSGPYLFVTDLARRKAVFEQLDRDVTAALEGIVPQLKALDDASRLKDDKTKTEAETSLRGVIESFK